jgi:membrane protein required for colicin V production
MDYLDIIILIILVISLISGYKKGFIHQLASLTALLLGIYVAIKFSGAVAPWMNKNWSMGENASYIIAFVAVFFIVLIGVHMAGKVIENVIDEVNIGVLNKLTGSVFSIAKAILILSAAFILLELSDNTLNWPKNKDKDRSLLYKPIESVIPSIFPLIIKEKTSEKAEKTKV